MSLDDIFELVALPELPGSKYCNDILPRLRELAEKRSLTFSLGAKTEWSQIKPGNRHFYAIEGPASGILGCVLMPDPKREHAHVSWNAFDEDNRDSFRRLMSEGYEGKRLHVVFLQCWGVERTVVLLPMGELEKVPEFRNKGIFHVKKDGGEYVLQTPRWEENIRLSTCLEDIFKYL